MGRPAILSSTDPTSSSSDSHWELDLVRPLLVSPAPDSSHPSQMSKMPSGPAFATGHQVVLPAAGNRTCYTWVIHLKAIMHGRRVIPYCWMDATALNLGSEMCPFDQTLPNTQSVL